MTSSHQIGKKVGTEGMPTWNVMLVDHDRLFSAALATILDDGQFRICHNATSLTEAITAIRQGLHPDLIVLNFQADAPNELAALKGLRSLAEQTRIVVLATDLSPHMLALSLQAGVDGYLTRSMSCEALHRSLQLVMLGEAVFPSDVANLLITCGIDRATPTDQQPAITTDLSKREVQILRCLLDGQSNKAIARNLRITESTVKMHFKNVMRKIHAQNRTQAAVWAIQNGLSPHINA